MRGGHRNGLSCPGCLLLPAAAAAAAAAAAKRLHITRCSCPALQPAMLARLLRQRGTAWLQLAAPAAGRAWLGSAGTADLAGLASCSPIAGAARRITCSAASASAKAATTKEAAAAQAAAPGKRGRKPKAAAAALPRSGTVVLVESPAKAKKIQEVLGPDYKVGGREE